MPMNGYKLDLVVKFLAVRNINKLINDSIHTSNKYTCQGNRLCIFKIFDIIETVGHSGLAVMEDSP